MTAAVHAGLVDQQRFVTEATRRNAADPPPDDGLFVARVSAAVQPGSDAFVCSTLTLGCPTRFNTATDVLCVVLLPGDNQTAQRFPGRVPGEVDLVPWYAAVDAGILEPGSAGPWVVTDARLTSNALAAALAETRAPTITARGLADADLVFLAAALLAAFLDDEQKAAVFSMASADFGWADNQQPIVGQWLGGLFGSGAELAPEHVRIMASFANPFVGVAESADGRWVRATAVLWADAPDAAKRLLSALDYAAARGLGLRVVE